MLDIMRRHSKSSLIYLVFGAIIVVFAINFGPGSGSCMPGISSSTWAAKVDGAVIPQQDFVLTYNRRLESMRRNAQRSGNDFTPEMAERFGLREQVIDQLIDRKLLAQEARRWGMLVSDTELLAYLEDQYGVKDVSYNDYQEWVNRVFGLSVPRFESDVRDEILAQRMGQVISDNVTVTDAELETEYVRQHHRAMVEYVAFDPLKMGVPAPSQQEAEALLANEPKAIEDRYQKDAFSYRTPERAQIREIVQHLPADADEGAVAAAKESLLGLRKKIEGGGDFAAVAGEHVKTAGSMQAITEAGHSAAPHWVVRGQLPPSLDDAVFKLKAGDMVAEPVRGPDGVHLIQLVEVQPPSRRTFAEVKLDVAKSEAWDRVRGAQAKQGAEALLAALKQGKALSAVTTTEEQDATSPASDLDKKLPVRKETPWILQSQQAIPRIGLSPELHSAIFALTEAAPLAPKVFQVGPQYYVVVLKTLEKPDLNKFAAEKAALREQAVWMKRGRVLQDWTRHLRKNSDVALNPTLFTSKPEESA